MSETRPIRRSGRDVVRVLRNFEKRWEAGHRAATVHQFERSRILGGDLSPIIRELEPALAEGERYVLSQTRPRGAIVLDRATGREIVYPKPPPEDVFMVEIRDVVRHKAGYWRVRFDVHDRRHGSRLIRRKPPARNPEWDRHADRPPDAEEIAQAAEESNYTTDPTAALDHLDAVPREYENVLQMRADDNWAEHERRERAAEVRKRELRQVTATLREVVVMGARTGVDTAPLLESVRSQIAQQREQIEEAKEAA